MALQSLPGEYSVEVLHTPEISSTDVFSEIDHVVLQAWKDHEPIVAEWLMSQPATAEVLNAWVWIIRYEGCIVATGRLTIHESIDELPRSYFFDGLQAAFPPLIASINRLAVIKPHSGKGLATYLDRIRVLKAHQLGAKSVAAICQERRARTLEKFCGFKMLREPRPGKALPEILWCVAGLNLVGSDFDGRVLQFPDQNHER